METVDGLNKVVSTIQLSSFVSLLALVLLIFLAYLFTRKLMGELKSMDRNAAEATMKMLKDLYEQERVMLKEKIAQQDLKINILEDDIKELKVHLLNRENQILEALSQKEFIAGKYAAMEKVFEKLNIKVA